MSDHPVLYVHPHGHPEEEVIPWGLVALMNALPGPKLGLFPHELTPSLARGAAAVLMDVHWYHGLGGARAIAHALRRAVPGVPVVVGGYTASVLAPVLVADGVADFVVVGDAERPLPELVARLRAGRDPRDVPNLVARDFETPRTWAADPAALDAGDHSTLDWFPSLRARVALAQASRPVLVKQPAVPTYKGCEPRAARPSAYCLGCYGQPRVQRALLGRNLVARSSASVRAELRRLSEDPSVARVCLFDDPIAMLGEAHAAELFTERLDLELYFEPHRFFSLALLERLATSFKALELVFYHEDLSALLAGGDAAASAFLSAARALGVRVGVCTFSEPTPALDAAARAHGVEILPNADEAFELPDPFAAPERLEAEYRGFLERSRASGVLGAVARISPAYLDAMALQLGMVADPGGRLAARLPLSGAADRCFDGQNPIERQVMAGANPRRLAFYGAPFALGAGRRRAPLYQVPLAALLASPSSVEELGFSLRERGVVELRLAFRAARSGAPEGLALNFVSERPGAMAGLPYDALWKLCLPLDARRGVRAGERFGIRVEILPLADGRPRARAAVEP